MVILSGRSILFIFLVVYLISLQIVVQVSSQSLKGKTRKAGVKNDYKKHLKMTVDRNIGSINNDVFKPSGFQLQLNEEIYGRRQITSSNPIFIYPKGLGPLLLKRSCLENSNLRSGLCNDLIKRVTDSRSCEDTLNGVEYIGIGIDTSSKPEEYRNTLIQKTCQQRKMYKNRNLPEKINAFDVYDTNVITETVEEKAQIQKVVKKIEATLYELSIENLSVQDLSYNFIRSFLNLPNDHLSVAKAQKYEEFIRNYGTHFVKTARLGGQLKIVLKVNHKHKSMSRQNILSAAEKKFQEMFHQSAEDTSQESVFESIQMFSDGGNLDIAGAYFDFYTTRFKDTYSIWIESLQEYAKPVKYTKEKIVRLLDIDINSLFPIDKPSLSVCNDSLPVPCSYKNAEELKEAWQTRKASLSKAIDVFVSNEHLAETSGKIEAGPPGCETQEAMAYTSSRKSLTWKEMKHRRFKVQLDTRRAIPGFSATREIFEVIHNKDSWFVLKPGRRILHLYDGCRVDSNHSSSLPRLCLRKVIMSYNESTGQLIMTSEDIAETKKNLGIKDFEQFIEGGRQNVTGKVYPLTYSDLASERKLFKKPVLVPCKLHWNPVEFSTRTKNTCLQFTASSSGNIYVVFSSFPADKQFWFSVVISMDRILFYRGVRLEREFARIGIGQLGGTNFYETFFVCLYQDTENEISLQYGKTAASDATSSRNVLALHTFLTNKEEMTLRFQAFGTGDEDLFFFDASFTSETPKLNCMVPQTRLSNDRCAVACHKECRHCREPFSDMKCVECRNMAITAGSVVKCVSECPPGYTKSKNDSKKCIPCQIGSYKNTTSNGPCPLCEIYSFSDSVGSKKCKKCPSTVYCVKKGCTMCSTCPPGLYSEYHITGKKGCIFCKRGTYNDKYGQTECKKCKPGEYAPKIKSVTCLKCEKNTISTVAGAEVCEKCPDGTGSAEGSTYCANNCEKGHFSPRHGEKCKPCDYGFFTSWAGQSKCLPCPIGTFSGEKGSETCKQCHAGTFSNATNSIKCEPCPAGYEQGKKGQKECIPCIAGKFAPESGTTICRWCGPGTYQPNTGQSECLSCPPGHVSGSVISLKCSPCPKHTAPNAISSKCVRCEPGTVSGPASKACTKCKEGEFSANPENPCQKCQKGFYSSKSGSTSCTKCRPGTYQSSIGQSKCLPCESGYISNGYEATSCSPCQANSRSSSDATRCVLCEPGFESPTGSRQCTKCRPGEYSESSGKPCKKCRKGFYSSNSGSTSCTGCQPGTYQPSFGQSKCIRCRSGYVSKGYEATSCSRCQANSKSSPDSTSCVLCGPGSHSVAGSSRCTKCKPGEYSESSGQPCKKCRRGTYSDATGSISCTQCIPGTYQPSVGQTRCFTCSGGYISKRYGAISCSRCQANSRSSPDSASCVLCEPGSDSVAGSSRCTKCKLGEFNRKSGQSCRKCEIGTYSSSSGSTSCTKCQTGTGSLSGSNYCTTCRIGEFSTGQLCKKCPSGTYSESRGQTKCKPCKRFHYQPQEGQNRCLPCNGIDAHTYLSSSSLEVSLLSSYVEAKDFKRNDCILRHESYFVVGVKYSFASGKTHTKLKICCKDCFVTDSNALKQFNFPYIEKCSR